ncbi:hypothetical protein EZS27_012437 [termite gut metagenome]|uniref:SbsA Ig-like domain-containing protein n=1 Tax=termite gut metagenome TaxID=433724 RepID=A0A5J4S0L8_9ZZZZ
MSKIYINKQLGIVLRAAVILILVYSCASIGRPEGGLFDETPPRFIGSTPGMGTLNNTRTKITLQFDEYIKLEGTNEKVIISPPQVQRPEIKPFGKKINVNLLDSLKSNTTYIIDFSDAISDNNEGNPLGNFVFSFSTGDAIDTMVISGTLVEASNLEPIKGMLVGLHVDLADSAFTSLPFERVSRTDSRGRFSIKGVAPGTYRLFGLIDSDQNFIFNQKSEAIAFLDSLVIPRSEERWRQDTIWKDSLTIDTIMERKYTHFLPDQLLLRSFTEDYSQRYLISSERKAPNKFTLYFAGKSDTVPTLKGLSFDEKDAFVIETTLQNDTIHYWLKDSLVYKQDTLRFAVNYFYTDTLNNLTPRADTLALITKKVKENSDSKANPKKKNDNKEEKKESPITYLTINARVSSTMDVYDYIDLTFDEPLQSYDFFAVHIQQKVDTLWKDLPFEYEQDSIKSRVFRIYCDWEPKGEYKLRIDSAAFVSIYGLQTNKMENSFKVKSLDDYGAIYFNVKEIKTPAFAELLDEKDNVVRKAQVTDGKADFPFLNPGKYGARLIEDTNGNGVWDTGNYEAQRQPEKVYYYDRILELKTMFELEQDWNIKAIAPSVQKPDSLKKQKPDEDKKKKRSNQNQNRNQSRNR